MVVSDCSCLVVTEFRGLARTRNDFRMAFKEEHPDVKGVAAVGKAGGERWKSMSEAVRIRLLAPI